MAFCKPAFYGFHVITLLQIMSLHGLTSSPKHRNYLAIGRQTFQHHDYKTLLNDSFAFVRKCHAFDFSRFGAVYHMPKAQYE